MDLLVFGGTVFVGRHLVEAARRRGHKVTIATRGREAPLPYADVEPIILDRRGDLSVLRGRKWQAAIDVAAYVPSVVRSAVRALDEAVEHYTFVSTRSVYAEHARSVEGDPTAAITDEAIAKAEAIIPEGRSHAMLYGPSYGGLKARCEREAAVVMSGRLLVVRPGLVVGPYDSTDRFTYWPRRVARGGDVLAPGRRDRIVRFIDGRDLAEWMIRCIEREVTGTFNAAGADGVTMEGLLEVCRAVVNPRAHLVWVSEQELLAKGVEPWMELPLWVPEASNAFLETGNDKAIGAGLTFRSIATTVRDTLAWDRERPQEKLKAGLDEERERAILNEVRAAQAP